MSFSICKVKNIDTVNGTYVGKQLAPDEEYIIPDFLRLKWTLDNDVIIGIANQKIIIGSSVEYFNDTYAQLKWLNDSLPTEVVPTTIKNDHTMQPCGCIKGYFLTKGASPSNDDYVCVITLSNKSQDGLTFTYNSDIPITPAIGNYVFQKEKTVRSWATAVDTVNHTITFELPVIEEGTGLYTRGHYVDMVVPDWHQIMYLWGVTVKCVEYDADDMMMMNPCESFIELSIVDLDDLFKMDQVCQALFGVNANTPESEAALTALGFEIIGEYGDHWTKYYDESWILNINGTYTHTPDGSPGGLLAGLHPRLSVFATDNLVLKIHLFTDYYLTAKDGE